MLHKMCCEHICIPSKPPSGATKNRTCMCSIGYTLKKPQQVGCYADFQKAPFLVFADIDHGLIFQMAMNDSLSIEQLEKHEYNVIPSELTDEIHALCVDQSTQTLFYADKTKKILVSKRQSEPEKIVAENIIALSCASSTSLQARKLTRKIRKMLRSILNENAFAGLIRL